MKRLARCSTAVVIAAVTAALVIGQPAQAVSGQWSFATGNQYFPSMSVATSGTCNMEMINTLNGTDSVAIDVGGFNGWRNLTWNTTAGGAQLDVLFRTPTCQPLPGNRTFPEGTKGSNQAIHVPGGTKWMIVSSTFGAVQVTVSIG
jgi:hypothetical protein